MDCLHSMRVFSRMVDEGSLARAARSRVCVDFRVKTFGGEKRHPAAAGRRLRGPGEAAAPGAAAGAARARRLKPRQ
jgi:hypothetical protein